MLLTALLVLNLTANAALVVIDVAKWRERRAQRALNQRFHEAVGRLERIVTEGEDGAP